MDKDKNKQTDKCKISWRAVLAANIGVLILLVGGMIIDFPAIRAHFEKQRKNEEWQETTEGLATGEMLYLRYPNLYFAYDTDSMSSADREIVLKSREKLDLEIEGVVSEDGAVKIRDEQMSEKAFCGVFEKDEEALSDTAKMYVWGKMNSACASASMAVTDVSEIKPYDDSGFNNSMLVAQVMATIIEYACMGFALIALPLVIIGVLTARKSPTVSRVIFTTIMIFVCLIVWYILIALLIEFLRL